MCTPSFVLVCGAKKSKEEEEKNPSDESHQAAAAAESTHQTQDAPSRVKRLSPS
jgi:hypothetical protein